MSLLGREVSATKRKMSTLELVQRHEKLYRSNVVSLVEIAYKPRMGWWACFQCPVYLTGRQAFRQRCWTNSAQGFDAMDETDRDGMAYVLAMQLRDKLPLQRTKGRDQAQRLRVHWFDTGIMWHDRISIQISYRSRRATLVRNFSLTKKLTEKIMKSLHQEERQMLMLAFSCCLHCRLGAKSLANQLDDNILSLVWACMMDDKA